MDSVDIWEHICEHLSVKYLVGLLMVSKTHYEATHRIIHKRLKGKITDKESLNDLIRWIADNMRVTYMDSEVLDTDFHISRDAKKCLINDQSIYSVNDPHMCDYFSYEFETHKSDGRFDLEDVFFMDFDLYLLCNEETWDPRGTRNTVVEMTDQWKGWNCGRGYISIITLAYAVFRLKCHKFENKYERVYGLDYESSCMFNRDNPMKKTFVGRLGVVFKSGS